MKTIRKVLIANRGEIAVRILRTLKRLGIESVLAHHAVDAASRAAREADACVELVGEPPVAAYLDIDALVRAAQDCGVDAVHPGFGFLSENALFAERLADAGIGFIGPRPETIALMGDKVRARAFCLEHGFPLAPSVVHAGDDQAFAAEAAALGFPLLIKAAAGGGGRGMQIVRNADALPQALRIARDEARRAFGDDRVYAERYIERPRHVEVQVLADAHGRVVHLGERECSIQRRFQKVIEEAPAPTLDAEARERIRTTAVAIARAAGYLNAGTVEFIVEPDGRFHFLEMNTRIQVEHPVTEAITGIDLIEQQVRVAEGAALPFAQQDITFDGHAIELRLYAEDPSQDFAPATGRLLAYDLPNAVARVDDGYLPGQAVTSAFDPMLAKLIVHGATREEAIRRGLTALEATTVLGVTTNRELLARVLAHPAFASGALHTGFLAEHAEALAAPPLEPDQVALLLAAAAQLGRAFVDAAHQPPRPMADMGAWTNR